MRFLARRDAVRLGVAVSVAAGLSAGLFLISGSSHRAVAEAPPDWWSPTSPAVTKVEPYPASAFASADAFWAEVEKRVTDWLQRVGAANMSDEEVARNSLALREALRQTS